MASANIKVSNAWQTVKQIYSNVGGSWKSIKSGWINVSGVWKLFFSSSSQIAQNVTISQSTSNSNYLVTLTGTNYYWSPNPTTLTYAFRWSTDNFTWTTISSGTATNPSSGSSNTYSYTVPATYASPNTTNYYQFVVTATLTGSGTNTSTSSSTTIDTPRNITLSANVTGTSASLSWTASAYANRYIVYYYNLTNSTYYYAVNGAGGYSSGTTSTTINNLSTGSSYIFYVLPITGFTGTNTSNYTGYPGNTANSSGSTALAAPNAPTIGTDPNNTTYTSIRFYWYASVDTNHNAATGYYWKSGPIGNFSNTGYNYDSTNGWYYVDQPVISGCPSGSATYSVYAYNSAGNSSTATLTAYANSEPTPATPTITTSSTSSNFTITANFGNNTTSVYVYYGTSAGSYPNQIGRITTSGGSVSPVGPFAASTTYYYQAIADNSGCSTTPVTGSVTTLPLPPSTPVFSYVRNGTSSGPSYIYAYSIGADTLSYTIYRAGTAGTGTSSVYAAPTYGNSGSPYSLYTSGTSSNYYYEYDIPVNGYYYMYATGKNAGGSTSNTSVINPDWFTVYTPPPAAPTNLIINLTYSSGPSWSGSWSATNATSYSWAFYVASDSSGTNMTYVTSGGPNSTTSATFNNGGTGYIWGQLYVTAYNSGGSTGGNSAWT